MVVGHELPAESPGRLGEAQTPGPLPRLSDSGLWCAPESGISVPEMIGLVHSLPQTGTAARGT